MSLRNCCDVHISQVRIPAIKEVTKIKLILLEPFRDVYSLDV